MSDLERLSQVAKQHVAARSAATAVQRMLRAQLWSAVIFGTAFAQLFRPGLSTMSACVGIAILVLDGSCRNYLALAARLWYQRIVGKPWHWERRPLPTLIKTAIALVLVLGAPVVGGSAHSFDLALRSAGVDPSSWNLLDVFAYLFVAVMIVVLLGVVIGGAVVMDRRRQNQTAGLETDVPQSREEIDGRR